MTNPYSTPSTTVYESPVAQSNRRSLPDSDTHQIDFGAIIRKWEWLRIFYNSILITMVMLLVLFGFPGLLVDLNFLSCVLAGAIIANLCFLTAPAIEGYGTHFRLWHPLFSYVLFAAGTFFAMILAIACVLWFPKI